MEYVSDHDDDQTGEYIEDMDVGDGLHDGPLDPDLPEHVDTLTLSYTFFDRETVALAE